MRQLRTWAAALLALVGGAGFTLAADDPPSYTKDVKPFLKTYCMDCHSGFRAKAGYSVATFDSLLKKGRGGSALVVPEKADESRLLLSMTGKTRRAMPPRNKPQPKAEEIAKVRDWIKAGAKDDTATEEKKVDPKEDSKKGDQTAAGKKGDDDDDGPGKKGGQKRGERRNKRDDD